MTGFALDRRRLLSGAATSLAAAATMSADQLFGLAKAFAQSAPWKPESGATINMLRWKRFVEAEDVAFMKIVDAFSKATGVKINISNESYDDIQPKASVAANTGQGLDMVWGLYSLPFLFPEKCTDVTDVADYLGKACGGWAPSGEAYGKMGDKWIGIPVAATGGLVNYRIAAVEKAGFRAIPNDLVGFRELCRALQMNGTPAGMAIGHASGDANGWLHWALWANGGATVDKANRIVVNSPETAKALEYVKSLYETFIPGTSSWNDSSNNKAFLAGQLYLTTNGISIYVTAKKENPAMAADINHAHLPVGLDGKRRELHLGFPILIFNFTKYPQACKAFTAFLLEPAQFNPWIEAAQGYLSHFLLGYDKNPIWTADPKTTPYRDVAQSASTPAGIGTMNEAAAAAIADFIVVDMFANYCTGAEDTKTAMASAERKLKRMYRS
ncbi:ABC transporter substrate-binding protein [Bradyrhizobium sp. U87765 SZCCT0131]|uniref:ABC transporter substrate-binding protein n=1 Tax=unclassified Bradyrhizobium TaxID=2631580 RepID=UPI001BA4EF00|nr:MULTISPECIES: ABC transporter substrate-binding protein [unclassified Bradyrhizobium]MBR1219388.1 ABC transporter substrate-binding protein [Bradyrhizobium sp. U87765 SZCCT0131]MBR1262039.1 ABC transporter substrate-binding protein [Bradyrhizobium sp. U87765 SZCCT0134]MBR1306108.1 ABC transporter substrate-binding protein [Bradyrhizobium sp. U87765 SZCCT0110]MBR1317821.1 ABC transporter substrate-binding protein [Bradyrhizobium sp. U87765 SZCCT0109]MBR1351523.1 ABC transporter substrate-bin